MTKHWALQDAKARLSELVRAAEKEPQIITYRGKPKVEVRLLASIRAKRSLGKTCPEVTAMRASPARASVAMHCRRRSPRFGLLTPEKEPPRKLESVELSCLDTDAVLIRTRAK